MEGQVDTQILSRFFEIPYREALIHYHILYKLYKAYFTREDIPALPLAHGAIRYEEIRRAIESRNLNDIPSTEFSAILKVRDLTVFLSSGEIEHPLKLLEQLLSEGMNSKPVVLPTMPAGRGTRIEIREQGIDIITIGYKNIKPEGEIGSFLIRLSPTHFICGSWIGDSQKGEAYEVYIDKGGMEIEKTDASVLEEAMEVAGL